MADMCIKYFVLIVSLESFCVLHAAVNGQDVMLCQETPEVIAAQLVFLNREQTLLTIAQQAHTQVGLLVFKNTLSQIMQRARDGKIESSGKEVIDKLLQKKNLVPEKRDALLLIQSSCLPRLNAVQEKIEHILSKTRQIGPFLQEEIDKNRRSIATIEDFLSGYTSKTDDRGIVVGWERKKKRSRCY